jgi:glycosyltransferase involved in cell wall biosynthesis
MGLRLGYLIPEFPQQTHIFFWREVVALREMGVDVRLFSTRAAEAGACRHAFAEGARKETYYVYPPRIGAAAGWLARHPVRAANALRYALGLRDSGFKGRMKVAALAVCAADLAKCAVREGLDHIHAHSCADAAHVLAMSRILGGPTYSLTLHGDLLVYGVDHRAKMARAAMVATAGSHLKRQIVECVGYPAERILPTCMGLATNWFTPTRDREAVAGRLKLVTVARLNAVKGHRHALAAMKVAIERGCDVEYAMAGSGPNQGAIETEVKRLGLQERVRMLGTRSEEEVRELLWESDAFVLPSVGQGEAYPVSVMEAMSAGLPVIVSNIGATAEMVEDGREGFVVEQGNEAGLSLAMVQLAKDVELRKRMGMAARKRASEMFEVKRTAGLLVEWIERWSPAEERDEMTKRPSDERGKRRQEMN